MAGVFIDNSRRNYPYLCKYYKKIGKNDSSLKHDPNPKGYFYAKEIKNVEIDNETLGGSFQIPHKFVAIETPDDVDITDNDIVEFEEKDWMVIKVMEVEETRRMFFSYKQPKHKQMILRI